MGARATLCPPAMSIFLREPPEKKPNDRESGDQKGHSMSSTAARSVGFAESSGRTQSPLPFAPRAT